MDSTRKTNNYPPEPSPSNLLQKESHLDNSQVGFYIPNSNDNSYDKERTDNAHDTSGIFHHRVKQPARNKHQTKHQTPLKSAFGYTHQGYHQRGEYLPRAQSDDRTNLLEQVNQPTVNRQQESDFLSKPVPSDIHPGHRLPGEHFPHIQSDPGQHEEHLQSEDSPAAFIELNQHTINQHEAPDALLKSLSGDTHPGNQQHGKRFQSENLTATFNGKKQRIVNQHQASNVLPKALSGDTHQGYHHTGRHFSSDDEQPAILSKVNQPTAYHNKASDLVSNTMSGDLHPGYPQPNGNSLISDGDQSLSVYGQHHQQQGDTADDIQHPALAFKGNTFPQHAEAVRDDNISPRETSRDQPISQAVDHSENSLQHTSDTKEHERFVNYFKEENQQIDDIANLQQQREKLKMLENEDVFSALKSESHSTVTHSNVTPLALPDKQQEQKEYEEMAWIHSHHTEENKEQNSKPSSSSTVIASEGISQNMTKILANIQKTVTRIFQLLGDEETDSGLDVWKATDSPDEQDLLTNSDSKVLEEQDLREDFERKIINLLHEIQELSKMNISSDTLRIILREILPDKKDLIDAMIRYILQLPSDVDKESLNTLDLFNANFKNSTDKPSNISTETSPPTEASKETKAYAAVLNSTEDMVFGKFRQSDLNLDTSSELRHSTEAKTKMGYTSTSTNPTNEQTASPETTGDTEIDMKDTTFAVNMEDTTFDSHHLGETERYTSPVPDNTITPAANYSAELTTTLETTEETESYTEATDANYHLVGTENQAVIESDDNYTTSQMLTTIAKELASDDMEIVQPTTANPEILHETTNKPTTNSKITVVTDFVEPQLSTTETPRIDIPSTTKSGPHQHGMESENVHDKKQDDVEYDIVKKILENVNGDSIKKYEELFDEISDSAGSKILTAGVNQASTVPSTTVSLTQPILETGPQNEFENVDGSSDNPAMTSALDATDFLSNYEDYAFNQNSGESREEAEAEESINNVVPEMYSSSGRSSVDSSSELTDRNIANTNDKNDFIESPSEVNEDQNVGSTFQFPTYDSSNRNIAETNDESDFRESMSETEELEEDQKEDSVLQEEEIISLAENSGNVQQENVNLSRRLLSHVDATREDIIGDANVGREQELRQEQFEYALAAKQHLPDSGGGSEILPNVENGNHSMLKTAAVVQQSATTSKPVKQELQQEQFEYALVAKQLLQKDGNDVLPNTENYNNLLLGTATVQQSATTAKPTEKEEQVKYASIAKQHLLHDDSSDFTSNTEPDHHFPTRTAEVQQSVTTPTPTGESQIKYTKSSVSQLSTKLAEYDDLSENSEIFNKETTPISQERVTTSKGITAGIRQSTTAATTITSFGEHNKEAHKQTTSVVHQSTPESEHTALDKNKSGALNEMINFIEEAVQVIDDEYSSETDVQHEDFSEVHPASQTDERRYTSNGYDYSNSKSEEVFRMYQEYQSDEIHYQTSEDEYSAKAVAEPEDDSELYQDYQSDEIHHQTSQDGYSNKTVAEPEDDSELYQDYQSDEIHNQTSEDGYSSKTVAEPEDHSELYQDYQSDEIHHQTSGDGYSNKTVAEPEDDSELYQDYQLDEIHHQTSEDGYSSKRVAELEDDSELYQDYQSDEIHQQTSEDEYSSKTVAEPEDDSELYQDYQSDEIHYQTSEDEYSSKTAAEPEDDSELYQDYQSDETHHKTSEDRYSNKTVAEPEDDSELYQDYQSDEIHHQTSEDGYSRKIFAELEDDSELYQDYQSDEIHHQTSEDGYSGKTVAVLQPVRRVAEAVPGLPIR